MARRQKVLDELDLKSTSEEEGDVAEDRYQGKAVPSKAPQPARRARADGDAEVEGEDADEDDDGGLAEGKQPEMVVPAEGEWEGQHLIIRSDTVPVQLGPDDETASIGEVSAVIDGLVVVRGDEGGKALDLQSVLACEVDRMVLGVVIDVFGLVTQPHYLILPAGAKKTEAELSSKVGSRVVAALSLPETSYLTDNVDMESLRRQGLIVDGESGGSDEDEAMEEESSADEGGKGSSGQRAIGDLHEELGKGKGKGAGKGAKRDGKAKGKGKEVKGATDRRQTRRGSQQDEDDTRSVVSGRDGLRRSTVDRARRSSGGYDGDSSAPPWRAQGSRESWRQPAEEIEDPRRRSRSPWRKFGGRPAGRNGDESLDTEQQELSVKHPPPLPPPSSRGVAPPPPPVPASQVGDSSKSHQHDDPVSNWGHSRSSTDTAKGKWSAPSRLGLPAPQWPPSCSTNVSRPPPPPTATSSTTRPPPPLPPSQQAPQQRSWDWNQEPATGGGNWQTGHGASGPMAWNAVGQDALPPPDPRQWSTPPGVSPPPPSPHQLWNETGNDVGGAWRENAPQSSMRRW